ncbi:MAG: HlyD family secretion protein [Tepidisphaeraceae bacterium]|jgi:membrane fusion protein (multidrug efflux system)
MSQETIELKSDRSAGGAARFTTPTAATPHVTPAPTARKRIYQRPLGLVLLLAVALGGAFAAVYWSYASRFEETDDAFIDGNIYPVGAKVAGAVESVRVDDNQAVNAGDVLAVIDPRDIQAAVAQARATLDAARADAEAAKTNVDLIRADTAATLAEAQAGVESATAGVATAQSQLASAQADAASAQAEATRRQEDQKRYTSLDSQDPRAVSRGQLDAARAATDAADAQLIAAERRVEAAQSDINEAEAKVASAKGVLAAAQTAQEQIAAAEAKSRYAQAQVGLAQAQLDAATLDLSYTTIKAPVAGRVTRKNVQAGQYLQVGQTLLAIVPQDFWVTANFKETQLTHMHIGQPVELYVDALPDRVFHGRVESFQAGTGARFSLLPAENATGNYVKVVQRVPVKISFDAGEQASDLLGLGMSVVPQVRVSEDGAVAQGSVQAAAAGN